jgi:2-aminoadipate transaminase
MTPLGVDPEAVLQACERHAAKAFYTIPNAHNPTGAYTPLESRQAILHGLSATDCAIIEDDYCPELSFRAESLASYFALDQTAERTFYIRSLGKIYLPGTRLGFMIAPQAYVGKALDLKRTADLHGPNIIQDAAEIFLREHSTRSRLRDDVVRMRVRAQRLFAALDEHLPEGCSTHLPSGGLSFWVALPHAVADRALYHAAVAHSVAFAPGSIFEANAQNDSHGVRISFGTLPEEAFGEAARRVTAALGQALAPPDRAEYYLF